jgi:signal transduction histidine kinase
MLDLFLDLYFTDERGDMLEDSANYVNMAFGSFVDNWNTSNNTDKTRLERFLKNSLDYYANQTGSLIWIVNDQRQMIQYGGQLSQSTINKYTNSTGRFVIPENKAFEKLKTQATAVRVVGDFNGFFKDTSFKRAGDVWLTVGRSFAYNDTSSGKDIYVTVYMHMPLPIIKAMGLAVFKYFFISVGVAIIIAVLLVYIFSRRLSRPLKQIRDAAAKIASGEFNKRLDIKSKDEIGELAKTFNQMAAALENLEEMRRGFVANVSHELRTPMTSIRGFIEGILDGTIPPERQNHYLIIVRDETKRLNRLVNDLLDLAKMEAGEMKLNIMPLDINELLRKCVINLETLLLEKDLTVDADFEEENMLARADADAIERVAYNLMHNAIKFTPNGGELGIRTHVQKDKIEITISDSGIGIDKDELDMIWDRFYKSDKSRGRDKTGTGLGLAIVRNIINEHGQKIWVESTPGKGTAFTFTLERAYEEDDAQ